MSNSTSSSTPSAPLSPPQVIGNATFATSVGLLMVRLAVGAVFIFHGASLAFGAFGGPGLSAFAQGLHGMPMLPPIVWAAFAAYGQFLGGVGLLLGLLTRLASIPLLINMAVAIATIHAKHGFSLQDGGYEYNLVLIACSLLLLLTGPGIISVDAYLFRRSLWAIGPQPLSNPVNRVNT